MIHIFTIFVGGRAYRGEDMDKTVPANIGGNGWHVPNQSEINPLVFGDTPKEIPGIRNLKSEITRILEHMQQDTIPAQSILIQVI